jgi:hypothetical protein
MPKKKPGMTPEEQSERFKADAQRLIDAGELNPIDADKALEGLVRRQTLPAASVRHVARREADDRLLVAGFDIGHTIERAHVRHIPGPPDEG